MQAQTILIVDDDPVVLRFLQQRLGREGHHVLTAGSGPDALIRASQGGVDLILLDLAMPGMGGYEVLDAMRKDSRTGRIPVMILTVMDAEEQERRGLKEGVVEYLSKSILTPDRIDLLLYRIRNFFAWQENERLRGILATIVSVNHEINNPLMVILNATRGLTAQTSGCDGAEPLIGRINDQCMVIKASLDRISDLNNWVSRRYVGGIEMLDTGT